MPPAWRCRGPNSDKKAGQQAALCLMGNGSQALLIRERIDAEETPLDDDMGSYLQINGAGGGREERTRKARRNEEGASRTRNMRSSLDRASSGTGKVPKTRHLSARSGRVAQL